VSCPKTKGVNEDDSFEEVEWEKPSNRSHTYSERLGNAVHLLFD
jgi:hypothetical protein